MKAFFKSRLVLAVAAALAASAAVALTAQSAGMSKGRIEVPLTKLAFDTTVTLYKRGGIELVAKCIGSFDDTGMNGDDIPPNGNHVAVMYLHNISAPDASSYGAGPDINWGPTSQSDHGDRHHFTVGDVQNVVAADQSGSGDDIAGGTAGALEYDDNGDQISLPGGANMGAAYRANGQGIVVDNPMASINLLGADCTFAAILDVTA
jgi:hypothetical protein